MDTLDLVIESQMFCLSEPRDQRQSILQFIESFFLQDRQEFTELLCKLHLNTSKFFQVTNPYHK